MRHERILEVWARQAFVERDLVDRNKLQIAIRANNCLAELLSIIGHWKRKKYIGDAVVAVVTDIGCAGHDRTRGRHNRVRAGERSSAGSWPASRDTHRMSGAGLPRKQSE